MAYKLIKSVSTCSNSLLSNGNFQPFFPTPSEPEYVTEKDSRREARLTLNDKFPGDFKVIESRGHSFSYAEHTTLKSTGFKMSRRKPHIGHLKFKVAVPC